MSSLRFAWSVVLQMTHLNSTFDTFWCYVRHVGLLWILSLAFALAPAGFPIFYGFAFLSRWWWCAATTFARRAILSSALLTLCLLGLSSHSLDFICIKQICHGLLELGIDDWTDLLLEVVVGVLCKVSYTFFSFFLAFSSTIAESNVKAEYVVPA